jgi:RHS repeat-associated protein
LISTNELRYTGWEHDGTGLNYYRARCYHHGLERFVSEDPIGLAEATSISTRMSATPHRSRSTCGRLSLGRTGGIRIVRAAVLAVVAILAGGCGSGILHLTTFRLTGDEEAIGAAVEVDGRVVGQLDGVVHDGSTSSDPVVIERERVLQRESGVYPGKKFAAGEIWVANGVRNLRVISKGGKILSRRFTMQGENYIRVRFGDMTIE